MPHPSAILATWQALAASGLHPGTRWRHVPSGAVYEVIAVSLDEATHAGLVTYRNGNGVICWTLDRAAFVERFERVE